MCLTPGERTAAAWQRRLFALDLFQKSASCTITRKDPGVFTSICWLEALSQEKGSAAKTRQEWETELVKRDRYLTFVLAKAISIKREPGQQAHGQRALLL